MCEHMGTGVQEGVQCSTWEYKTMSVGCSKRGGGWVQKGCMGAKKGTRVQGCIDVSYQATGSRWGERRGKKNCQSVCLG